MNVGLCEVESLIQYNGLCIDVVTHPFKSASWVQRARSSYLVKLVVNMNTLNSSLWAKFGPMVL